MLKTLAGLYFDEGKDRDAVLVYSRMIREKPVSVEAPLFQSRIVTCAGRMGRKDAAVQQAHVFVKLLRDVEASAEGRDPKNAKVIAEARADAERTLRILAVQYHNEWKKTRDEPVAGYAADVYRDYLDVFPNDPPAYEMRFFHAELLYALSQFAEAGSEYELVAEQDVKAQEKQGKPGKFFKDALENAVFSYDLVAKKLDETGKVQPGDPQKRIPFAPARQKLVEACERYLKYQPKGDKWVEIAYKAANLYYRHNAFGEASDLFTRIALDHPTHELAGYSANLVLDAYNLLGDWRNVNGWAKRFYANKALLEAHPQLREDLGRVIEQSAFKVIEERERAKDWDAATDEYLAFARDWPGSKLASTSLYNASVDQVRAGRLDWAMEIRDQFLRRYPEDRSPPSASTTTPRPTRPSATSPRRPTGTSATSPGGGGIPLRRPGPRPPRRRGRRGGRAPRWPKARRRSPRSLARSRSTRRRRPTTPSSTPPSSGPACATWPTRRRMQRPISRPGLTVPMPLTSSCPWPTRWSRRGQSQKELAQLEEYQKRYARDPDDWLAIQHRMARIHEKAGDWAGGAAARRGRPRLLPAALLRRGIAASPWRPRQSTWRSSRTSPPTTGSPSTSRPNT